MLVGYFIQAGEIETHYEWRCLRTSSHIFTDQDLSRINCHACVDLAYVNFACYSLLSICLVDKILPMLWYVSNT